ncbi:MAG TPA: class I SAM-dependent methyltransferase [Methylibium sp.]|nr:class I SAM-dependent methyltransferase [Methylibium sp.]
MDVTCPLCHSEAAPEVSMPIDAKTFAPTRFGRLCRCRRCRFAFVHPRPTPAETEDFYRLDRYYTQGRSHVAQGAAPSVQSRLRDHLAWRLDRGEELDAVVIAAAHPGAHICDVGCGDGALCRRLAGRGYCVVGIERDRQAVGRSAPGFEVFEGAVEALPEAVRRDRFDVVVLWHVLEHLVDPITALQRLAELLVPHGRLVCAVPNNASVTAWRSGLAWEHLDVPRHLNFFDPDTLAAAVARAGLRVERHFYGGYCRYFSNALIATEQRIHDAVRRVDATALEGSVRNSQAQAWRLLARTAFAAPQRKYDSVGVVAGRPGWPS